MEFSYFTHVFIGVLQCRWLAPTTVLYLEFIAPQWVQLWLQLHFPTAGQNLWAERAVHQQRNYPSLAGNIIMEAIHREVLLYTENESGVMLNRVKWEKYESGLLFPRTEPHPPPLLLIISQILFHSFRSLYSGFPVWELCLVLSESGISSKESATVTVIQTYSFHLNAVFCFWRACVECVSSYRASCCTVSSVSVSDLRGFFVVCFWIKKCEHGRSRIL